jgi:hypothetical protein
MPRRGRRTEGAQALRLLAQVQGLRQEEVRRSPQCLGSAPWLLLLVPELVLQLAQVQQLGQVMGSLVLAVVVPSQGLGQQGEEGPWVPGSWKRVRPPP